MRPARVAAIVLTLAGALTPRLAAACAACVSSAYGDRGFNWGYGGLLIAPFLVMIVIVGVLGWNAGYRLRWRPEVPRSQPPSVASSIPVIGETT
jgi:hypothetical protein